MTKIGHFQSLILVANLNQNTTCYNVLELVKCDQQYTGQFVVIYSTCQKLFAKNQTEGPGIKIVVFGALFRPVRIVRLENYLHL